MDLGNPSFSGSKIARTMRHRRLYLRFELNIANECYFGWQTDKVMARWSLDLEDSIFSGLNSTKNYAPSAPAFNIWIEYRERVLFWTTVTQSLGALMTNTKGHGAIVNGPGQPFFHRFDKRKEYAPSALAFKIWSEYRERVLFWMTDRQVQGAMVIGLGWLYFLWFE